MTNLALMRLLIMQNVVALHIMTYCATPWIFKWQTTIISSSQHKMRVLLFAEQPALLSRLLKCFFTYEMDQPITYCMRHSGQPVRQHAATVRGLNSCTPGFKCPLVTRNSVRGSPQHCCGGQATVSTSWLLESCQKCSLAVCGFCILTNTISNTHNAKLICP